MIEFRHYEAIKSGRRGMLLLVVMLMLSLFMAIGAFLLTIGLRARNAARAYGDAATSTTLNDNLAREALDDALLAALRGSPFAATGSVAVLSGTTWENILEDKYGKPIFATGSIQPSPTSLAFITLSLSTFLESGTVPGQLIASPSGTAPSRLNGRVLTVKPRGADGEIASYRILGASGTNPAMTVHVATMPENRPRRLPSAAFDVIINGREFTPVAGTNSPETYDAHDDANLWLAQPIIENAQVSHFNRGSFLGNIFPPDPPNNPNSPFTDLELLPAEDVVDNDNDGVLDGIWLPPTTASLSEEGFGSGLTSVLGTGSSSPVPGVVPDRPSPMGGTIRTQVSYLILDLDGRININAAGASAPSGSIYGSTPTSVPLGMGYGPADLDPSLLFPASLPTGSNGFVLTSTGTWQSLLQSGTPAVSGTLTPTVNRRRVQPLLGLIEGRYGQNRVPGITGDDSSPFQLTGTASGTTASGTASSYWSLVTGSTSTNLADLQGRRKAYMQPPAAGEITPTLTFFTGTAVATSVSAAAASDAADDPYELRLDADAPRPSEYRRFWSGTSGTTVNPFTVDNPFTLPELERILRANDPDALQLPQRLAAGAAQHAQQARMTITTDSWDTPALTGAAGRAIEDYMARSGTFPALAYTGTSSWRTTGSGSSNPVSPDIAAGLRFNINRPVLSGTSDEALRQQHEYCKGLYTLALMLGETNAARAAQWAVNALDFRDEDDRISWFEYDTNISNGWNVDGLLSTTSEPNRAVVWGAERPDVVITETAASDGSAPGTTPQILITVRRVGHPVTTASGTISPTSLQLTSPRWQIRFGSDDRVVRFNPNSPSPGTPYRLAESGTLGYVDKSPSQVFTGSSSITGTNPHVLSTGSAASICICPQTVSPPSPFGVSGIAQFNIVTAAPSTFSLPTTGVSAVFLERLADPDSPPSSSNPYVVVDRAPVQTAATSLRRPATATNQAAAFWATNPTPTGWTPGGTSLAAYSTGANQLRWFHWPNRPFISQAELALVPTGSTGPIQIFADLDFPALSLVVSGSNTFSFGTQTVSGSTVPASGTASLGNLLLEATYVPSRFAGNALTVSGSTVERFGLDIFQANQLSKWREPGKVNINTIVSGTSLGTVIDVDDIVWSVLMSNTTTLNNFAGIPRTRTQPAIPNGGGNPATPAVPGRRSELPPTAAMSIGHLLSLSATASPPNHFRIFETATTTLSGSANGFRDTNPFFTYSQAVRLANTATIRSQVFAVWITVKITDDSPNAPSPVTKRMFAIIDRSIPVGYAPGQDLNVRDTIRLKRYLD